MKKLESKDLDFPGLRKSASISILKSAIESSANVVADSEARLEAVQASRRLRRDYDQKHNELATEINNREKAIISFYKGLNNSEDSAIRRWMVSVEAVLDPITSGVIGINLYNNAFRSQISKVLWPFFTRPRGSATKLLFNSEEENVSITMGKFGLGIRENIVSRAAVTFQDMRVILNHADEVAEALRVLKYDEDANIILGIKRNMPMIEEISMGDLVSYKLDKPFRFKNEEYERLPDRGRVRVFFSVA